MKVTSSYLVEFLKVFVQCLPRTNRFTNLINHRMFQLAESGLIIELEKRVMENVKAIPLDEAVRDSVAKNYDLDITAIDLNAFILLFAFLGLGFIGSIIAFMTEVLGKDGYISMGHTKKRVGGFYG